jgi:hypothetical protein
LKEPGYDERLIDAKEPCPLVLLYSAFLDASEGVAFACSKFDVHPFHGPQDREKVRELIISTAVLSPFLQILLVRWPDSVLNLADLGRMPPGERRQLTPRETRILTNPTKPSRERFSRRASRGNRDHCQTRR